MLGFQTIQCGVVTGNRMGMAFHCHTTYHDHLDVYLVIKRFVVAFEYEDTCTNKAKGDSQVSRY